MDITKSVSAVCGLSTLSTPDERKMKILTKVVRHQHIVRERMIRTHGHQRLMPAQSIESHTTALALPPRHLLFDMMEERHDVAETVLHADIAIGDGDEQNLEFFRKRRAREEDGQDVIDALREEERCLRKSRQRWM